MLPHRLFSIPILLALIINVASQYFDFVQGFQALIQPYPNNQYYGPTTKRTQVKTTQDRKYDSSAIFFQENTTKKPKTTTTRPRKTTRKNVYTDNIRNIFGTNEATTQNVNKGRQNDYPAAITFIDEDRKIETNLANPNIYHQNSRVTTNSDIKKVVNNNFARPQKVVNPNFDNKPNKNQALNPNNPSQYQINLNKQTTRNPIYNNNQAVNFYTTNNPLINQPGVKPANVDENQPPITNSPVANEFYNFPGSVTNSEDGWEPPIEIGPNEDDMTQTEKRRYVEIAEEVCNEYRSRTVRRVVALPLSPTAEGHAVNVSDCTPINIPLIIGGTISKIEEFPHMALVGWRMIRGGYSWKCGGSLISDQYVLTAGHCTFQEKDNNAISGPPQAVQLGSAIMDDFRATVVQVASVIRHPKYKRRRVYHDVAMIKLMQRVSFSDVIRPACLGRPPGVGDPIIATGWGRTEFGGDQSRVLRSVSLPIWNMEECREVWGTPRKLPNGPSSDNQLCAGEKNGGKDTCQGDSGGPAQTQDGCMWRVVAVTSYGRSCGAPETPALYAKIPIPFVAAKVFADRKSQTNLQNHNIQNNYGITESHSGYQNNDNSNNYNQPNYGSNQPDYNQNQPNYNKNTPNYNQNYDRNTPNYNNQQRPAHNYPSYDRNQENINKNIQNYDRNTQNYNNQNFGINQDNFNRNHPDYSNQNYNRNQPDFNNQPNANRYQPDTSQSDEYISSFVPPYARNPSYENIPANNNRNQYEQPNYGYSQPNFGNTYKVPEVTRPWWSI